MRPAFATPRLLRRTLLLALLLLVPPTLGKRKKAGGSKGKGKGGSEAHARLLSERDRLVAALAQAEQGCDALLEDSPMQTKVRPALQPAQVEEFAQHGYTIVRALVPGDVVAGLSSCMALARVCLTMALAASHFFVDWNLRM